MTRISIPPPHPPTKRQNLSPLHRDKQKFQLSQPNSKPTKTKIYSGKIFYLFIFYLFHHCKTQIKHKIVNILVQMKILYDLTHAYNQ